MGCSRRAKEADIRPEQKWDFISLNDFKSTSCFAPFAFAYLLMSLLVSVAVYGVDTFTAVNLLAFNKWSSEINPAIPLDIAKWIFSACIIASWVNLGYEYFRAIRVIKRGAVAESYLDSLAVRVQCIRFSKQGRGWRRFLVFAELTKSKKGAEYVALFTYFSFQAWIRIIFCQGPRQVVNALTLWEVYHAQLDVSSSGDVGSAFVQFFRNIAILAQKQQQQAVILSGMLFTLVIWVFGALSLILAALFYVFFLWHYIPNADGGLSGYCERKTNHRLSQIVSVKVNKAIEEEERKRLGQDAKAFKKGEKPALGRQATLPTLFDPKDPKDGDKLPNMPMLNRNDTTTTLPVYSSRPGTPSGQPALPAFELDQLDQKRPFPSRSATGTSAMSNVSYASDAPLMGNASEMGYGRPNSPAPSLPQLDTNGYPAPPQRAMTGNSSNGFPPPQRSMTGLSTNGFGPPPRSMTGSSINAQTSRVPVGRPPRMPSAMGDRGYTASPVSYDDGRSTPGYGPPGGAVDSYGRPMPRAVGELRSNTPAGPAPSMGRRTSLGQNYSGQGQESDYGRNPPAPGSMKGPPGPGSEYGRNSPAPSSVRGPISPTGSAGYQPYNPAMRAASNATPTPPPSLIPGPGPQQYRNMTDPGVSRGPGGGGYFNEDEAMPMPMPNPNPQRPGTAQSGRVGSGGSQGSGYNGYDNGGPARLASPAPYNGGNNGYGPGQGQFRR